MIQQKIMGRIVQIAGWIFTMWHRSPAVRSSNAERGAFRQQNIKPCVGDWATVELTEQGTGYVVQLEPAATAWCVRRWQIWTSWCWWFPSLTRLLNAFVLDKLIAIAEYQKIEPVIVITKCDLADPKGICRYLPSKAGFCRV